MDVLQKARQGKARQNGTIDRTWQNHVLPQDVKLVLAMPRLASNDQGPSPGFSFWPCLAVQVMTEEKY